MEGRNGETFSNTIPPFAWRQWERKRSSPGQYILPHGIEFSYSVTWPDSLVVNIQRTELESLCIAWERIRNIPSLYFLSHNLIFLRINPLCIKCGILLQNNQYRYTWKGSKCVAREGWTRSLVPIAWKMKKLHRVKKERNILQTKRRKTNWIGHILRRNCLLRHVYVGWIKWGEDEEEEVVSYWMRLR